MPVNKVRIAIVVTVVILPFNLDFDQSSRECAQGRTRLVSLWQIWVDDDHNSFSFMLVALEASISQHPWVVLSKSLARGRATKATSSL
jgi:hypothetical protein